MFLEFLALDQLGQTIEAKGTFVADNQDPADIESYDETIADLNETIAEAAANYVALLRIAPKPPAKEV